MTAQDAFSHLRKNSYFQADSSSFYLLLSNFAHMLRALATLILLGIFATACQLPHDDPREIAHKYLKARLDQQFDKAAQYILPESLEHLAALENLSLEFSPLPAPVYRIMSVSQKGHQATVRYQINGTDQDELVLERQNTHWLVQLTELSVPDAGLLYQELRSLEREEAQDMDLEDLDQLLLEEEDLDLQALIATE